jgi:hypothetical protein
MSLVRGSASALLAAALLFATPVALPASEPEQLSAKSFDVAVRSEGGRPLVEVTFSLALSEISTYPVTITAVGSRGEEKLWEGVLGEGTYRLRAPLTTISAGPLKVVFKTKMTNRSYGKGESYLIYRKWEGTIPR